jgi:hypothetical protein
MVISQSNVEKENTSALFECARPFVKAIRAVFTSALAAISPLQVIPFREDDKTFFRIIIIFGIPIT